MGINITWENVPLAIVGFIAEEVVLFGFLPQFNFMYLLFSLFPCWAGKVTRGKNLRRRFKAV